MRKYAILKEALPTNSCDDKIKRIILYETKKDGIYVFLSTSVDDVGCNSDSWFEDIKSAEECCADYGVHPEDWIEIDDPMPNCQHDFIRPVRVKGRNNNNPQWGKLEIFNGSEWVDLTIDKR